MIIFKSPELKEQFNYQINTGLKNILYALAGYLKYNFAADLLITSLVRHDVPILIHWSKRAADAGTEKLTSLQAMQTKDWLNTNFPYGDGVHQTCLYEMKGEIHNGITSTGNHLHIQTIA